MHFEVKDTCFLKKAIVFQLKTYKPLLTNKVIIITIISVIIIIIIIIMQIFVENIEDDILFLTFYRFSW